MHTASTSLRGIFSLLVLECFANRNDTEDSPQVVTIRIFREISAFDSLPKTRKGTLRRIVSIAHPLISTGQRLSRKPFHAVSEVPPQLGGGISVAVA
jgi:hypothetical protein